MRFGVHLKKKLTGTDLYVHVMQVVSIFPVLYLVYAPGYMPLFRQKGFLTRVFEFGCSALPRIETYLISLLYRLSFSEPAVSFAFPVAALAFGLIMNKLLHEKYAASRNTRFVLAALVAVDLVLRLLPLHFNEVFPQAVDIAAFVLRFICLALITIDLIVDSREKKAGENKLSE